MKTYSRDSKTAELRMTARKLSLVFLVAQSWSAPSFASDKCEDSVRELSASVQALSAMEVGHAEQWKSLERDILKTRSVCDVRDYDVGMALVSAYQVKGDLRGAGAAYSEIVPKSALQSETLAFRAALHFTKMGSEEKSKAFLRKLTAVSINPELLATARVSYECRFKRCALVLDQAVELVKKHPDIIGLRVLLGQSYADRHEFEKAAKQFAPVVESDVTAFDSISALIAVATFSNVGQKALAAELVSKFSEKVPVVVGVNDQNFAQMKAILKDTSGTTFLFSRWPIEPQSTRDK